MFDGMRYVPVLLRGEVALLKEVPEDDVASSTCTERYGKRGPGASFDGGSRTSRGTRETGRRASDASAISEEESESDDEGESVHVSQDGLGPAETEAERRERLHAEFFAGQDKRAKFPTSKAAFSAVFHSFRLIFGRAIIYRNGLEAWMLLPERARAEHSR